MPIPIPHLQEDKQEFLSRCSGALETEFSDSDQRLSVCSRQWSKKRSKQHRFSLLLSPVLDAAEFTAETDIPAQDFRKEVMRVGKYSTPDRAITPQTLKRIVKNFRRFEAKGLAVPFVSHHEAGDNPRDFLGYVIDMDIEGDSLFATFSVRGLEQIQTVHRVNQVSIELWKELEDQDGEKFKDVVTRIALTPMPAVNGQEGFSITPFNYEEHSMLNQKELSRLAVLIGDDEITSDNALDKLEAKFSTVKGGDDLQEKYDLAVKSLDQAKQHIPPQVDEELAEEKADFYCQRFSRLVERGVMSGDMAEKFQAAFIGEQGNRNTALLFSRKGTQSLVKKLLDLLEDMSPVVEFGQRSRPQTGILSDNGRSGAKSLEENEAYQFLTSRMNNRGGK